MSDALSNSEVSGVSGSRTVSQFDPVSEFRVGEELILQGGSLLLRNLFEFVELSEQRD